MTAYEIAFIAFFILLGLVGVGDAVAERVKLWLWKRRCKR